MSLGGAQGGVGGYSADVQRGVESQRSYLMGVKEAEARRNELGRQAREKAEREFEARMRSGELINAHRDALRRMQSGVKDAGYHQD
jgi:hypothetical protein